jgi:tetratricopeptide (TPR) repeat protein
MGMRRALLIPLLLLSFSCGTSNKSVETQAYAPPPPPKTALDRKLEGMPSQEVPLAPPVDLKKVDTCTRYLLFADQYITASDYDSAADALKEASRYCSPDDPRYNYMKAVVLDANEQREEAYRYYYKAAKGYLKKGDKDSAFKCYSNMLSINPNGKEVQELKGYFQDNDY